MKRENSYSGKAILIKIIDVFNWKMTEIETDENDWIIKRDADFFFFFFSCWSADEFTNYFHAKW